jgi:hypothetical protein
MKNEKYCPLLITCLLIGVLVSGCGGTGRPPLAAAPAGSGRPQPTAAPAGDTFQTSGNAKIDVPIQISLWYLQGRPPQDGWVMYDACVALRNTSNKTLTIASSLEDGIIISDGSQDFALDTTTRLDRKTGEFLTQAHVTADQGKEYPAYWNVQGDVPATVLPPQTSIVSIDGAAFCLYSKVAETLKPASLMLGYWKLPGGDSDAIPSAQNALKITDLRPVTVNNEPESQPLATSVKLGKALEILASPLQRGADSADWVQVTAQVKATNRDVTDETTNLGWDNLMLLSKNGFLSTSNPTGGYCGLKQQPQLKDRIGPGQTSNYTYCFTPRTPVYLPDTASLDRAKAGLQGEPGDQFYLIVSHDGETVVLK